MLTFSLPRFLRRQRSITNKNETDEKQVTPTIVATPAAPAEPPPPAVPPAAQELIRTLIATLATEITQHDSSAIVAKNAGRADSYALHLTVAERLRSISTHLNDILNAVSKT